MGVAASSLGARAAFLATSLGSNSTQNQTNGNSVWGTSAAPVLPKFLTSNPLPNGYPWSNYDTETDYYLNMPETGITRSYHWTVSRGVIAPDGFSRDVMLVNGAFPGPLIEANWGDTIEVTLHNNITGPEEGTALHWHGFLQHGTPWQDGVPAVTQCPVAPEKSFTYSFRAQLYGTSWYHGHYSAQYAGGMFGPIVIYGPEAESYDIDLGPIMVSDWYHDDYFTLVQRTLAAGGKGPFPSDNNLINGKMNYDCSKVQGGQRGQKCFNNAGVSKFTFTRGKRHRLRLINTGAEGLQHFSIDGHSMTVIANDFVMVEPYETDVVTLGIGQRTEVLVDANADGDAFWMRSSIPLAGACGFPNAEQATAFAAVYYDDADMWQQPQTQPVTGYDSPSCDNDDTSITRPLLKQVAKTPDVTFNIETIGKVNDSGIFLWHMNGTAFRGNYNSPTLLLSKLGNYTFEEEWNVINTGDADTVRVILSNPTVAAHPLHLHGFNMQILSVGLGVWDGTTISQPDNPSRRDVIQVPAKGHLVMQFEASGNPGVWPFHCHIAWHVSAGFLVQFLTKPSDVKQLALPQTVAHGCREWRDWTKTNIPNQIDSGL